jgi:hypothetical protein
MKSDYFLQRLIQPQPLPQCSPKEASIAAASQPRQCEQAEQWLTGAGPLDLGMDWARIAACMQKIN